MNTVRPQAVIVTPTIDFPAAYANMVAARAIAGVDCASIIVGDVEKRGYIIPMNACWRAALEMRLPYLVVLGTDSKPVTKNWLALMIEHLESDAEFGVASARGGCRGGPQTQKWTYTPVEVRRPLADFVLVAKRAVFLDIGCYDSEFIHYAGESDWQMRAMQRGWKLILVPEVYFDHEAGVQYHDWWAHDRAIYTARWGGAT